jgi:RNA polymerase sigma factor (sigma-70 family)
MTWVADGVAKGSDRNMTLTEYVEKSTSADADQLLRAAAAGDKAAWADLVRTQSNVIWSVIRTYRIPEASAADVYQAVWLIAVEKAHTIRDGRCIAGWLATTTRRECINLINKTSRIRYEDTLTDRADETQSPEDQCVRSYRDQTVHRAINRLPNRDRQLLHVLMNEHRPHYREVSRALRMPVGSIGPTRARALDRLRSEFARMGVNEYSQIA